MQWTKIQSDQTSVLIQKRIKKPNVLYHNPRYEYYKCHVQSFYFIYFWISQVICIADAVGLSVNPQHTTADGESILLGRELQGQTGS